MKPLPRTLLALMLALRAAAADTPTAPSTNAAALAQEAAVHNPELRFYEAELDAARASRRTSGRQVLPEVSGSVGQKRSTDAGGGFVGDGVAWSVGVTQSFEWPGRLGLRKAIADHDVALAELGLARFRTALSARVRGQAHALGAADEKSGIARKVADRYRALREVLVLRDPSGITPQLEIRILEATEIGLRRRATEAGLAADDARLSLNHLLGRPVDAPLAVAATVAELPTAPRLDALLAAAATHNFELRLRETERRRQGFRVSLAGNERWPAIKVGPQVTEENAGGRDRIIGVGVSFPLPLWRDNTSDVAAAKARQIQAETVLGTARREVERRVVSAARAYEVKVGEMARWSPDSLARFAEAAELADRHYRLAAVPVTTYVELQKQYLEAVETLLDTRREAIAAAAELEELTGLDLLATP